MKKFKYREIVDGIKKDLLPGLKPGALLPGEAELCRRYETSAITVKKALTLLAEAGLVKRIPGKGTVCVGNAAPQVIRIGTLPERTILKVLTLNGWTTSEILESVCRQYSRLHPDVEFEFTRIANSYYDECRIADFDLVLANTWMMREYLTGPDGRELLPLHSLPGLTFDEDAYFSSCLKWCRRDDQLYSLPLGVSPVIAMFHQGYPGFKRQPWRKYETAAEYLTALYRLKCERQGGSNYYPFMIEIADNRWPSFIRMLGGRIFDPVTGECTIDRPEVVAAFRRLVRLSDDHVVPGVQWNTEYMLPDWFAGGKIGCMWGSYKHLRANLQNRLPVKYQILPEAEARPGHLLIESLLVTRNCRNPEAAGRFFNHLQTASVQLAFCRQGDTFTAQRDLAGLYFSHLAQNEPTIMSFIDGLDHVEPVVTAPRLALWKALSATIPKIWMGLDGVESICREIAELYNRNFNALRMIG